MLKGILLNEYLNLECIIESIFDLNFKVKKHGRGSFNRTRVTRTLFCFALCSITVLEVEARGAPVIPWRPLHLHSLRKSMVQSSDLQHKVFCSGIQRPRNRDLQMAGSHSKESGVPFSTRASGGPSTAWGQWMFQMHVEWSHTVWLFCATHGEMKKN